MINNVVRFNFPNINLPDSTNDEPHSHGYVQYKVKLKNNLTVGTQIPNTGYIYFDFNPPVATNVTNNIIQLFTIIDGPAINNLKFNIFPNPLKGNTLNIIFNKDNEKAELVFRDIVGREVFSQKLMMHTFSQTISLPSLQDGLYGCVITTDRKSVV